MITMDELYPEFCRHLLRQIALGQPPKFGLCSELGGFVDSYNVSRLAAGKYQKELFTEAGLDEDAPFNRGYVDVYKEERDAGKLYQNPERLAWLKKHATL